MSSVLRVKDLPDGINLEGIKLKTKKNVVGYFHSKTNDVVLLSDVKGLNEDGRLYPQILVKPNIMKEWIVLEENDNTPVNCHKLTQLRHTTND